MKHVLTLALLVASAPAWALLPPAITPAEEAMCQARVYSRLGARDQNTMHMHHYCNGLRFLDRAYASMTNKIDMAHYLAVAINNFNYVLENTQENYYMRGEVHVNKARALRLAGKKGEAAAEFANALRYELAAPDAYQALSDHYLETGNKTKALEIVTEGLRRNPGVRGLERRYTKLGGKLPMPAAIETAPVEKQATNDDMAAAASSSNPLESAPQSDSVDSNSATAEPVAEPKIGSPTNPYCRFCPD